MADITMPQLGETVTEGTITRWLKNVGDKIDEDEVLYEVSTDKVDSEVPSPVSGYLSEILVPEGETAPDMFVLDMRDVPWDGSAGVTLTAAWDGHGMAATQSHAMAFSEFPVTRPAWPGQFPHFAEATGGFTPCLFTAVIVGVVEVALETARQQVMRRRDTLRAYERVEWSKAELEAWLIEQAYEGMLRAMEQDRDRRRNGCKARRRSRNWPSRS